MLQNIVFAIVFIYALMGSYSSALFSQDPHFVIFTGSYNNEKWVERSLRSVASQTYPNWECIYVNDASTDRTCDLAMEYVKRHNLSDKITIINHSERKGLVSNLYRYLHLVDPRKIIVILDGDDRLAHSNVLKRVAQEYKDPSVWMTYGNYQLDPKGPGHKVLCAPLPKKVLRENSFRKYKFVTTHLRTFYAKLFQRIHRNDLQENGQFFQTAGDVATMMPMLEMSSKGHIRFIDQVLLKYNTMNPASDFRRRNEQRRVDLLVRRCKPYTPLKILFDSSGSAN